MAARLRACGALVVTIPVALVALGVVAQAEFDGMLVGPALLPAAASVPVLVARLLAISVRLDGDEVVIRNLLSTRRVPATDFRRSDRTSRWTIGNRRIPHTRRSGGRWFPVHAFATVGGHADHAQVDAFVRSGFREW